MIAEPCPTSAPLASRNFTLPPITTFIECTQCGYEPADQLSTRQRCPKCLGFAWRRLPRPGGLLAAAESAERLQSYCDRSTNDIRRAG